MTLPPSLPAIPVQSTRSPARPDSPASGGATGELAVFGLGAFDALGDDVQVALHGELDMATGPELLAGLAALAGTPAGTAAGMLRSTRRGHCPARDVRPQILDTSGLTALDDSRQLLTRSGWRVCLTRPRPAVLRLLNFAISAG